MSIGALRERAASAPAAPAGGAAADARSPSRAPHARDPSPSFAAVLRGLGGEIARGESLVRGALGAAGAGGDLAPAQLIALQAGVYRYGEAVDLASRLVDRAAGTVKTVLEGQ